MWALWHICSWFSFPLWPDTNSPALVLPDLWCAHMCEWVHMGVGLCVCDGSVSILKGLPQIWNVTAVVAFPHWFTLHSCETQIT